MDHEFIRSRMREVFERSGMNQVEFARTCDLAQSTVARLLSGKRAPELETLVKVCRAFAVQPAFFILELHDVGANAQ